MTRSVRLAILLWLALGVIVWNVVFDYEIRIAANTYLARQGYRARDQGPRVTIDEIMQPAASRGVLIASAWAVALSGAGLAAIWIGARGPN